MNELNPITVRNSYRQWLIDICGDTYGGARYETMLNTLHFTEFYYYIPNDDNRAQDGIDLRRDFAVDAGYNGKNWEKVVNDILSGPCSVLEMMVAFSMRIESEVMRDDTYGDRTKQWFWVMCENLGLTAFPDNNLPVNADFKIRSIATNMMDRRYSYSGEGGLFPLKHPRSDQRLVELWYQMAEFMEENY